MKPSIATILTLTFAACFVMWVFGCSARTSSALVPASSSTTPPPGPAIENAVQQAGGVNTQATGINYYSTMPLGTVLITISIPCFGMLAFWIQAVMERIGSHRREMKRITMNGKH